MNGIGLLVLIAITGQLGLPQAQPQTLSNEYGWERDSDDGALCFIVQVSPSEALFMQSRGEKNPADIPEFLIGRATRVVFRIGTELLPQTPSKEELQATPRLYSTGDVTAMFEKMPGRVADVEPESLVNVQQDRTTPTLPNFGGTTPMPPRPDSNNIFDQVKQNTGSLTDNLPNLARGTPSAPIGSSSALADRFPSRTAPPPNIQSPAPALPTGLPGTPSPRFNDPASGPSSLNSVTANAATQNPIASNLGLPSTSGSDWRASDEVSRLRDEALRTADRSRNNFGQNGNYNYPQNSNGNGAVGLPPNPPSMERELFGLSNSQTPAPGFGTHPGSNYPTNNGGFAGNTPQGTLGGNAAGRMGGRGYGSGGYGGGGYAGNGYGGGGYAGGSNVKGPPYSNRPNVGVRPQGDLPVDKTARQTDPINSQPPTPGGKSSSSDLDSSEETKTSESAVFSKTTQGFLQVFLLFSLVVNCYLGYLISKLLNRYRSVLVNLRAQTT